MKKIMLASSILMLPFITDGYAQSSLDQTITSASTSYQVNKNKSSGTLYTTPSVPQAAYFAGANPCLVGVGAGGAGGPIGLSFAYGKSDEACQRRSDAGAWHSLGYDDIAFARMCEDDDNRKAVEMTGRHCPNGVAIVTPASAPPPPTTLQPAPNVPLNQAQPPRPVSINANQVIVSNAPTWCKDANRTDQLHAEYVRYMCGG
jgi:hypothetical protein